MNDSAAVLVRHWLQMLNERKHLPIADSHDEILAAIEQNQVVLIRGETGSGKTTQVSNCHCGHLFNTTPARSCRCSIQFTDWLHLLTKISFSVTKQTLV